MGNTLIDKQKFRKIVQNTYKEFKIKERTGKTKSATISEIVRMIKKELKEDVN